MNIIKPINNKAGGVASQILVQLEACLQKEFSASPKTGAFWPLLDSLELVPRGFPLNEEMQAFISVRLEDSLEI